MYYYDWTIIILLPAIALSLYAQIRVSATYNKYQKVAARSGYSGSIMARQMLDAGGLYDVKVQRVAGKLTDHYDPRHGVLALSQSTYDSTSVAALGVAAHECGHALQHADNYLPLKVRGLLVPVANIGSNASWILIILGLVLSAYNLIFLGIICFTLVVLFQMVTLPVEFNASRRALAALEGGGFLQGEELDMTSKVLKAASLTYVAAALTSVLQLLRLLLIFGGRRD